MTFFTLENCDCSLFLFLLLEIFIGVFKVASAITTSDCCTYKVRALVDVMDFLLGTKECGLQVICRFTSREDWRRDCQICDVFITVDKGGRPLFGRGHNQHDFFNENFDRTCYKFDFFVD